MFRKTWIWPITPEHEAIQTSICGFTVICHLDKCLFLEDSSELAQVQEELGDVPIRQVSSYSANNRRGNRSICYDKNLNTFVYIDANSSKYGLICAEFGRLFNYEEQFFDFTDFSALTMTPFIFPKKFALGMYDDHLIGFIEKLNHLYMVECELKLRPYCASYFARLDKNICFVLPDARFIIVGDRVGYYRRDDDEDLFYKTNFREKFVKVLDYFEIDKSWNAVLDQDEIKFEPFESMGCYIDFT